MNALGVSEDMGYSHMTLKRETAVWMMRGDSLGCDFSQNGFLSQRGICSQLWTYWLVLTSSFILCREMGNLTAPC